MNAMHHLILLVLAVGLPNNIKAADLYQYKVSLSNITYVLETIDIFFSDRNTAEPLIFFGEEILYGYLIFDSTLTTSSTAHLVDENTEIPFCDPVLNNDELLYVATGVVQQILTGGRECPIKAGVVVSLATEGSEQFSLARTDCTTYDLQVNAMTARGAPVQLSVFAKIDVSGDETACNPNSP